MKRGYERSGVCVMHFPVFCVGACVEETNSIGEIYNLSYTSPPHVQYDSFTQIKIHVRVYVDRIEKENRRERKEEW